MFVTDQACLLRKAPSGEHHQLLVLFMEENGLKYALARKSGKRTNPVNCPDLFQFGEIVVQQKDPSGPAFLKDFSLDSEFPGIGSSYSILKAASALARFYENNLLHMESYHEAWNLLQVSLQSLADHRRPEITLLKAGFIFARSEGYPVVAHWLKRKLAAEQNLLAQVLQRPVQQVDLPETEVLSCLRDLNEYFSRETDLRPMEL